MFVTDTTLVPPTRARTAASMAFASADGSSTAVGPPKSGAVNSSSQRPMLTNDLIDLLEHFIGGFDHLRIRFVCALTENHVDHFLDHADV